MKKWICIIGATVLTPICLGVLVGFVMSLCWLLDNYRIVETIVVSIEILFLVFVSIVMWMVLHEHCKEYWEKRRN